MMGHIDDRRLNDYLDGLLSDEDRVAVDTHLEACAECADYLAELAAVVDDLGSLPLEAEPTRDLWSGIHSRIDGAEADVVELPVANRAARQRFTLTVPQALAAGLAMAVVSAGLVWAAMRGPNGPSMDPTGFVSPIPAVQTATDRYDSAITELEQLIEANRGLLSPETLVALENSLATIDDAIEDAREALAQDPNSDLLNRLYTDHKQSKLRVLQRASTALQL